MKIFFVTCFACLFALKTAAQSTGILPVHGIPSKEIYDLLVDRKGFLWIANDLGLSRYDGTSFVNFATPKQASLSVTDLVEDAQGRIWCHNFNGQILYVENEQLHLLHSYAQEAGFPRIALLGDQLVATTSRGLFVCDTKSLRSRYVPLMANNKTSGTSSLVVWNKQVIAYGDGRWFRYSLSGKATMLQPVHAALTGTNLYVHPVTDNDTLLVTKPFPGYLYHVSISLDKVILVRSAKTKDYINTITRLGKDTWINSKANSFTLKPHGYIAGLNLTDIVTDREGNTWYSSLKKGLMARYSSKSLTKSGVFEVANGDFVRCFDKVGGLVVYGTQNGKVVLMDLRSGKVLYSKKLPEQSGSVERVSHYSNGNFFIAASVGTWELHVKSLSLTLLDGSITKDTDSYGDLFFSATATALTINTNDLRDSTIRVARQLFPGLKVSGERKRYRLQENRRSRAVKFDPATQLLYAAFNNGLHTVGRTGIRPVKFEGSFIYASSMARYGSTVFAGAFNQGLFVFKEGRIRNYTIHDGLHSNTVLKMRIYGDHLWVIFPDGVQLFDLKKEKIDGGLMVSSAEHGIVYDVLEDNGHVYVATYSGVFEIPVLHRRPVKPLRNYLLYVLINNQDTVLKDHAALTYDQNNVQFHLAAPSFHSLQTIYFKYRLVQNGRESWSRTRPNEKSVNYAALMPGKYTFEAVAATSTGNVGQSPVRFSFMIRSPWWKQWWFVGLEWLAGAALVMVVARIYYLFSLQKQREIFEKRLAVERERQRIGDEIHDDISAGLSALRLKVALIETQAASSPDKEEISGIASSISSLSAQMREVIWALNAEHDTLENLVYYLDQQGRLFFRNTGIALHISLPEQIAGKKIPGEKRRNIYLAVKEGFQNIVKHARATEVSMDITVSNNMLEISVRDNGVGLSGDTTVESSGLQNMERRVRAAGGTIAISSDQGTRLTIRIPV